jgi:hypothetical protein
MSDYDVSPSEMRRLGNISDSELDAMRDGHAPNDDQSMQGVARFVQDLGTAFPERSTADLEDAHIAAMMQVVHLMADNGEPVAKPASKASGPEDQASGLPKPWRETIMNRIKTVFATRAAKVTAAAVAMLLALSGVAVAGVLPDPIQHTVADAANAVGINLPGGTDEVDADVSDPAEVDGVVDSVDQPDQEDPSNVIEGDQGEDQQDAVDEAAEQDADDAAEQDAVEQPSADDAAEQDADEADHQGAVEQPAADANDQKDASDSEAPESND